MAKRQRSRAQRLDVVDELHAGVHHPDVGPLDVADLAGGVAHQAEKDGRLLRHQHAGEGDAAHRAMRGERPQDLMGPIHLDRADVVFVGDQDVAVCEQLSAIRIIELIEPAACHSGRAVLPDDLLATPLHLDHALI